jgi:uncharacterized protein YecT (DUF1311 family)
MTITGRAALGCAALLVSATSPLAGENDAVRACLDRMTGGEQKQCIEQVYRAASVELDAVYRSVMDAAGKLDGSGSVTSRAAMIARSQGAWESYRDAECRGVVGLGGSGGAVWFYGCLAEKTLERIQELKVPFFQR